ncbi:nucleotide sugar dehydrogenase [Paenisporosarcina antarctica]|uniref:Nucleotide sugar dehydrogenase n=1 Tax=Paenisporosarcina antarctica TaxID=417367 RepID=A0A4V1AN73_9BACL|nr:nucleotide sugar dehydrogenase [Paenisporosarcina antarctica]QBP41775.1 nucleotide sugar dehydrogenase [Paenisporosarcina antarctica]
MKKICVIGLGYIGLPTAVMFANHGYQVLGVDVSERAINLLSKGQVHIEEPGLQGYLNNALVQGTFTVSTTPEEADMFIVAVPSPITAEKTADMKYIESATASIVPFLKKGDLVVLESTVPPRTVMDVMIPILEQSKLEMGIELFISHSPERVIPGKVFEELVNNSRIIGGFNLESAERTKEFYQSFVKGEFHITDVTTAEMVKVIENTFRDVNIAFANELAKMSENLGVNAWEAISLANHHPRVNIHYPGPGVGGHCIAVDPWFLVEKQSELAKIIYLSRVTNDGMPKFTVEKILEISRLNQIDNPRVSVLGLTFKANIDDIRESPSMEIVEQLSHEDIDLVSFDPHVKENKVPSQTQGFDEAITDSDIVVILTNHDYFTKINPHNIAELMSHPIVLDTKNAIDRKQWEDAGFTVYKLGDGKGNPVQ